MFNRQLHLTEAHWIKDNAKRYAQQKGINEADAEKQLAQQAYRQVQVGTPGAWDEQANAFLSQAHGMLAADPNCPSCGPGYMFQATAEQKANPNMYASTLPQTADFYSKNGVKIPTPQQVAAGAQRDSAIRDSATTRTLLAPVVAASTAIGGLGPTLATWVLANPVAATNAGIITADVGAQIASGAVTPTTVTESVAVKTTPKGVSEFTSEIYGVIKQNMNVGELAEFKLLDPNTKFGLTGSSATGKGGNPNKATFGQAIDPNKFDLDLFIQKMFCLSNLGRN